LLAEALQERLPGIPDNACLEDVDYHTRQLLELIKWLTAEAGVKPEVRTADGSPISSQEQLVEEIHTEARYGLAKKELKAQKVQAQFLSTRRDRILPAEEDLQKIARYEAHLSRQMYQALHELEALQKRRSGEIVPLARVDVHGP
jgi:vacuolar-type H+-ATPase subunit H